MGVHDSLARDDSAREDGSDASDDAERGARLLKTSPSDELASKGTAPAKTPTLARDAGSWPTPSNPFSSPFSSLEASTSRSSPFSRGVMYVGHDKLCASLRRKSSAISPWMGGWSRCNAHNTHGGQVPVVHRTVLDTLS